MGKKSNRRSNTATGNTKQTEKSTEISRQNNPNASSFDLFSEEAMALKINKLIIEDKKSAIEALINDSPNLKNYLQRNTLKTPAREIINILITAIENGRGEILEYLLEEVKIPADIRNNDEPTALYEALNSGVESDPDPADLLIRNGADPSIAIRYQENLINEATGDAKEDLEKVLSTMNLRVKSYCDPIHEDLNGDARALVEKFDVAGMGTFIKEYSLKGDLSLANILFNYHEGEISPLVYSIAQLRTADNNPLRWNIFELILENCKEKLSEEFMGDGAHPLFMLVSYWRGVDRLKNESKAQNKIIQLLIDGALLPPEDFYGLVENTKNCIDKYEIKSVEDFHKHFEFDPKNETYSEKLLEITNINSDTEGSSKKELKEENQKLTQENERLSGELKWAKDLSSKKIREIEAKNTDLLKALQRKNAELERKNVELDEALKDTRIHLEASIKQKNKSLADIRKLDSDKEVQKNRAKNAEELSKSENSSLKKEYEKKLGSLNAKITLLESAHNSEIESLIAEIDSSEEELNNKSNKHNIDLAILNSRILVLGEEVKIMQGEVDLAQKVLHRERLQNSNFRSDIAQMAQDFEALRKENRDLIYKNQELEISLSQANPDVIAPNEPGHSSLYVAAINGNVELIRRLGKLGASLDIKVLDKNGNEVSAINDFLEKPNKEEIFNNLIAGGVNPDFIMSQAIIADTSIDNIRFLNDVLEKQNAEGFNIESLERELKMARLQKLVQISDCRIMSDLQICEILESEQELGQELSEDEKILILGNHGLSEKDYRNIKTIFLDNGVNSQDNAEDLYRKLYPENEKQKIILSGGQWNGKNELQGRLKERYEVTKDMTESIVRNIQELSVEKERSTTSKKTNITNLFLGKVPQGAPSTAIQNSRESQAPSPLANKTDLAR